MESHSSLGFDLSISGIQQIIQKGESETVEFKEKIPPEGIISRIIVSFANSKGGIIIFGVSERDEEWPSIIGLTDSEAKSVINQIQRLAKSLFDTSIDCQDLVINGKKIVFAIIDPAPPHLKPITTATGEKYERIGTETRKIDKKTPLPPIQKKIQVKAFVAMSFKNEEEPALIDYYEAMKRACEKTKLPIKLIRIDQIEGDFEISQRIMNKIDECQIVIADFTLSPGNVYFEVGYARGAKTKHIIQTARKGTILEFDVRNWKTIFYKNATDLETQIEDELEDAYNKFVKDK